MNSEKAALLVRCRFPTGKGNRVRVVIDEETTGELDCLLHVRPGEHQIRVFGLQLGALKSSPLLSRVDPNDENLFGITLATGGYSVFDPVDAFGSYVLTDNRLQTDQNMIWQLYGSISQFYLVRFHPRTPHSPWKLELAKDLRSNTRALYPQQFDPCSQQPAP